MITAFLLKSLDLDVSPALKRTIVGEDPSAALEAVLEDLRDNVHDFFDFRDATVEPFSAIVSQVLVSELMDAQDILDWALRVSTVVSRIKREDLREGPISGRGREAVKVMGRVLQVSRLRKLLNNVPDHDQRILRMYEEARLVPELNAEPLFWLQFAILLDSPEGDLEQLTQALEHIRSAYDRAESNAGYQTYQLDTYHMRLLLHIEMHRDTPMEDIGLWQEIVQLLEKFGAMLRDADHRDFVIRVLAEIEPFVGKRSDCMGAKNILILKEQLRSIVQALNDLPAPAKEESGVEPVRFSLLRSIHQLGLTGRN
ncbi:hypothetical protein PWG15_08840 [Ensifer adhaerens]|uniref:hypothetical protein n=1 Tax=Ensifer adhaerens TaxID=106592 RepID=UPI0023A983E7|nr:hypothetical protein [Ensifer adhaerens]WDZ78573.1 hypothetical protein PWG15_08840 [Ensifer adhaerens]